MTNAKLSERDKRPGRGAPPRRQRAKPTRRRHSGTRPRRYACQRRPTRTWPDWRRAAAQIDHRQKWSRVAWKQAAHWTAARRRIRQRPRKARRTDGGSFAGAYVQTVALVARMQRLPAGARNAAFAVLHGALRDFAQIQRKTAAHRPSGDPARITRSLGTGRGFTPTRSIRSAGQGYATRPVRHAGHGLGGGQTSTALPTSRAAAVYHRVYASYLPRVAALANDHTLTAEQRQAALAALRLEQEQTAQAAMERELSEERALSKSAT